MLIVEMVSKNAPFFQLNYATWTDLLDLAKTNGWVPEGTQPTEDPYDEDTTDYMAHFEPTYAVSSWQYCKRITDADAFALSKALLAANAAISSGKLSVNKQRGQIYLKESMTEAEYIAVNSDAQNSLLPFARFAAAGGFDFAWDD